ncbi:hypothetical protein QOT17_019059 [Balamuthia mandrillaris]
MQNTTRGRVLALYRDLLRHAEGLPNLKQREEALRQTREAFRANKALTAEAEVHQALRQGRQRLAFLRMTGPSPYPRKLRSEEAISGTYVYKEGEGLVRGRASRSGTKHHWDLHTLDPEDLARHQHLLERQHFLRPPPPHVLEKDL